MLTINILEDNFIYINFITLDKKYLRLKNTDHTGNLINLTMLKFRFIDN